MKTHWAENTPRHEAEGRERYRHFLTITTRLMDNDLYNHVNNATYYSFIDTAVTSYLANSIGRDLATGDLAYSVAAKGCTYFPPISFPHLVHCGGRVSATGRS